MIKIPKVWMKPEKNVQNLKNSRCAGGHLEIKSSTNIAKRNENQKQSILTAKLMQNWQHSIERKKDAAK